MSNQESERQLDRLDEQSSGPRHRGIKQSFQQAEDQDQGETIKANPVPTNQLCAIDAELQKYLSNLKAIQNSQVKSQDRPQMSENTNLLQIIHKLNSVMKESSRITDVLNSSIAESLSELSTHTNKAIARASIKALYDFLRLPIQETEVLKKYSGVCQKLAENNYFMIGWLSFIAELDNSVHAEHSTLNHILSSLCRLLAYTRKPLKVTQQIMWSLARKLDSVYRPNDENKCLVIELLSLLLSVNAETRGLFRDQSGIEITLKAVKVFRKKNYSPDQDHNQVRFAKGLFSVLEFMVQDVDGLKEFNSLDGCKTMTSFFINLGADYLEPYLRPALSVLSRALTIESCQTVIVSGGLLYLFPVMVDITLKDNILYPTHEMCLRALRAFVLNTNGIFQYRIFNKLKQKDFELIKNLMLQPRNIFTTHLGEVDNLSGLEYSQKLIQGLTIVEQIDELIIILCVVDFEIGTHMRNLLAKFKVNPLSIRKVLARYCKERLDREEERRQLEHAIEKVMVQYLLN